MAYIQRITPPPNEVLSFSLKNFTGGLNNRSEQLQFQECSDVINMVFDDDTVMSKRHGQKYYDDVDIAEPIIFLDEFRPYKDADVLVRITASKIYFDNTSYDVTDFGCGINHSGKYIFTDGSKLMVYGKFAQTTTTYEKVIGTAVDAYTLMEITSPASDHAQLGTTHVKGVTNIDYTAKKVFYEPCENEFKDTYKGANVIQDGLKFLASHNGRVFASGAKKDNDNVFISDVNNAYYYPTALPLQLPPNSDEVVGLIVYDNAVVVGRHNDLYSILGNTNRVDLGIPVFELRKINSHTGFVSNKAISVAHNYLFFFGNDGNAYSLNSSKSDVKILSTSILTQQIDITKKPLNLTVGDFSSSSAIFYKDEWYVCVKDIVLIYSYRHRSWTVLNHLFALCFYIKDNVLMWGNKTGRLAQFSTDYLDFGEPYEAYWYSKRFDMSEGNTYKQFREFFIIAHTYDEYLSDINITFEIDYVDVSNVATISNQMSIFGRAIWGDRFINRNMVYSLPFVIGRRGRTIRFKFSNGYFVQSKLETLEDLNSYPKKENSLVYVVETEKHYLLKKYTWEEVELDTLNQGMKIYEMNGDYELRGKR